MMNIYFYESNREIVTENVVKCYSMISKYGFQPSMGKIKMVEGDDLKSEKLYKVSVISKRNDKPLSITNFMIDTEEVTDEEERRKAKSPVDGQHRLIAMGILEAEDKLTFDESSMVEIVKLPEKMSLPLFTASINNGKPWNYKDFNGSGLSTGNEQIDYLEKVISDHDLKPDFLYGIYTLGQPELKANVVKDLKVGIDKLPKNLKLNKEAQSMGDELLQAFKASKMSEKTFNNGRLAKGLKQFFKDKNPTIEQMVAIIEAMNKDVWHTNYPKPKGSPEAKNYAENFAEYYKNILSK
ncbi:hypothetical protein AALK94_08850 [Bacteroides faecichinchillae]|uniref:hypothetical protein n=1 Tax=Bacteroides faecichinchillae TaxID=871325 RepID=UPI003512F0F0